VVAHSGATPFTPFPQHRQVLPWQARRQWAWPPTFHQPPPRLPPHNAELGLTADSIISNGAQGPSDWGGELRDLQMALKHTGGRHRHRCTAGAVKQARAWGQAGWCFGCGCFALFPPAELCALSTPLRSVCMHFRCNEQPVDRPTQRSNKQLIQPTARCAPQVRATTCCWSCRRPPSPSCPRSTCRGSWSIQY